MSRDEGGTGVQLQRQLSLLDAVSVGLGAIIGAGIFVLIGIAAGIAGSGVLLAVVLSGVSATFTALSFCELGAALPRAGGPYEFGHTLISPFTGFMMGWLWVSGNIVLGATASLGFGSYLSSAFPEIPVKAAALGLIALVTLLNVLGAKLSASVNNLIVVLKLLALVAFSAAGLPRVQPANLSGVLDKGLLAVVQASGLFYFAYIGFPRITTLAEEVKDPERNIPRAILLALAVSSTIYLLVAVTAVGTVGWVRLSSSQAPLAEAAEELGLKPLLYAGGLLATFSVVLTSVMGQSRIFFAMARNMEMPYTLSKLHSRFRTPAYTVLLSGAVMAFLVLTIDLASLASLTSFCVLITHILTNYAALRLERASLRVRYDVRGVPIHSYAGMLLSTALTLSLLGSAASLGAAVVLIGALWYATYTKLTRARKRGRAV
ncbi:MAG: APC family permease [Thermofilum sp.]